ncbi:MAG: peptidoglycan-binding protein [Phormidesmis sp. CAN_BIN44]|nr:peptidoglycan-binding protein [Phormidesmis sp. CAN_BIN44]
METLAYLHLACANELPDDDRPVAQPRFIPSLNGLNWQKLSSAAWVKFLSIAVSLTILSIASSAMALLQQGDSGTEVSDLQSRLATAGCYNGSADGVFGSVTKAAVVECQQRNGLNPDGVVGPATEAALSRGSQTVSQGFNTSDQNFSNGTYSGVLRQGDRGSAVSDLQRRLSAAGYYSGAIDGIFGQQTEDAVLRLQRDRGLTVDGIAGYQVTQALSGSSTTIPDTSYNPSGRQLTIGDSGSDVEDLQRRLQNIGYFNGTATGYFGTQTSDAVQRFQQDRRLPVTGIADARTLTVLGSTTAGNNYDRVNRYIVVVPKQDYNTLFKVRQVVPSAFEAKSKLGDYVLAGAYPNQNRAEKQSNLLRSRGLDARVAYR